MASESQSSRDQQEVRNLNPDRDWTLFPVSSFDEEPHYCLSEEDSRRIHLFDAPLSKIKEYVQKSKDA